MPTLNYSLTELADAADVTVRTIRYYVAQGLLASPGAGPSARYGEGHVLRLRLVKQLQAQHLPLAEIRQRLAQLNDDEIRQVLEERAQVRNASALDYIRGVLGGEAGVPAPTGPATPASRPPTQTRLLGLRAEPLAAAGLAEPPAAMGFARASEPDLAVPSAPAPVEPFEAGRSLQQPDRSQWDRIALAPDVELHIRRPLSRIQNKRVERLISIAREILEEDQP